MIEFHAKVTQSEILSYWGDLSFPRTIPRQINQISPIASPYEPSGS